MDIQLLYGREGLQLTLPADANPTVIEKPPMPVLDDPSATIAAALDAADLGTLASGARSACILICDITRPVPNGLFLRPIIERLMAGGIAATDITILVATGLHRPNVEDELAEVVGDPWVSETVTVANHFARDDEAHVEVGHTSRGTVIKLDRRFVDADLRIATGLIEPHLMAGYSGGRKVITPGIAHADTITTLHNYQFMSDPRAVNCNLDGNPLHEEQLEAVAMIGGALALNTVIDDKRRLAFVNFGEIVASHLEAVAFMRPFAEVKTGRRFKTVVTSSAGYPLDKSFYQTIKGLVGPLGILESGGDLFVASRCEDGLGSPEYVAAQRRLLDLGREGFLASTAGNTHASIDEWQTMMLARPPEGVTVTLYSDGLDEEQRRLTSLQVTDDLNEAVAESLARHDDRDLAVIPEGPYVVPFAN
ncbi:MAG: nickel-dependent lactate racemase [Planctomycetota bacterium]|nr:nickel-dependent lactate racemase [Planctomycetota bacterium]